MRVLYYVPMIHSDNELNELGPLIQNLREGLYGQEAVGSDAGAIANLWQKIRSWVLATITDYQGLVIYQDGIPVGPREKISQLFELVLADHPHSQFFLLTRELIDKGAVLEGTEDIGFLIKRVAIYRQIYQQAADCHNLRDAQELIRKKVEEQDGLVVQADQFIAERIDQTLPDNGQGIIFMGHQHKVDEKLMARQQAGQLRFPIEIHKLGVIIEKNE